jgi:hypothetical protein
VFGNRFFLDTNATKCSTWICWGNERFQDCLHWITVPFYEPNLYKLTRDKIPGLTDNFKVLNYFCRIVFYGFFFPKFSILLRDKIYYVSTEIWMFQSTCSFRQLTVYNMLTIYCMYIIIIFSLANKNNMKSHRRIFFRDLRERNSRNFAGNR